MALALQPASHEARHGTVAEAGWVRVWAAATVKRQACCCFRCHASPDSMRLNPRSALAQCSCKRLAFPGSVKKLCRHAVLHRSHGWRGFPHDEGYAPSWSPEVDGYLPGE